MDRAPHVLVAGEALIDELVTADGEPAERHPGGGPFTAARALGTLGVRTSFLGGLSRDGGGDTLRAALADAGVGLSLAPTVDAPTTTARATLDAQGAASYAFALTGTSAAAIGAEVLPAALAAGATAVHVGGLGLVAQPIGGTLTALVERLPAATLVLCDPNIRPAAIEDPAAHRRTLDAVLARTDVLKLSDQDLEALFPDAGPDEALTALLAAGPGLVLLTRGGDGAEVVTAEGRVQVAAEPVELLDTVGAGDVFGATFLAWAVLAGHDRAALSGSPELAAEGARLGARGAAWCCARAGAQVPSRLDVGLRDAAAD
jgi:fructokinase